jgi:hypothetical protein
MNTVLLLLFLVILSIAQAQLFCERSGSATIGAQDRLQITSCERRPRNGYCALLYTSIYESFTFSSSTWSLFVNRDSTPFLRQSGEATTSKKALALGTNYNDDDALEIYVQNLNSVQSMTVYYQVQASYVNCSFITPNQTTVWPAKPSSRLVQWHLDQSLYARLRLFINDQTVLDTNTWTDSGKYIIDQGLKGGKAFVALNVQDA